MEAHGDEKILEGEGVIKVCYMLGICQGLPETIKFLDSDGYHAVTVDGHQDGAKVSITLLEYYGGGNELITIDKSNQTHTTEAVDADGRHTIITRRWNPSTQRPYGAITSNIIPEEPLYSCMQHFSELAALVFGEVRSLVGRPHARKPNAPYKDNDLR